MGSRRGSSSDIYIYIYIYMCEIHGSEMGKEHTENMRMRINSLRVLARGLDKAAEDSRIRLIRLDQIAEGSRAN